MARLWAFTFLAFCGLLYTDLLAAFVLLGVMVVWLFLMCIWTEDDIPTEAVAAAAAARVTDPKASHAYRFGRWLGAKLARRG